MRVKKGNLLTGNDLGFGNHATLNNQRMINPDGSSNISRKGLPFFRTSDTYISLITMSWFKFIGIILLSYLTINCIFALVYVWIGIEHLNGTQGENTLGHFFDAFFFSAQTISTVGYGHISPQGFLTSWVAALESMLGLLAFALATGLLYGRFSRPYAKIIYSKNILVAPYQDGEALMFRMANYRSNQLIEVEVQIMLSINVEENGKASRKFWNLPLERNKINLLTLSWTVVHPINEDSPIYGFTKDDLNTCDAEFLVLLKAFDDTFSQTVHSRTSYQNEQVVWKGKFKPVYAPNEQGILEIDLSKLNEHEVLNT